MTTQTPPDDEDRYMSGEGEAFGSITTEIGVTARAALKEQS